MECHNCETGVLYSVRMAVRNDENEFVFIDELEPAVFESEFSSLSLSFKIMYTYRKFFKQG